MPLFADRGALLEIPIKDDRGEEEIVELDLEDSDLSFEQILELFGTENAKLSLWFQLAVFYYQKKKYDEFRAVLEEAIKQEQANNVTTGDDHKLMKLRVLTTLAAYYMKESNTLTKPNEIKKCMEKATALYNKADEVSKFDEANLVGKGFLYIARNEFDKAHKILDFQLSSAGGENHIPALLGKACILFNSRKYSAALKVYRKVLMINPDCPACVRVGMGVCFERMKQTEKAKVAFERALELDPQCLGAMVGIAILGMNSNSEDGIKNAAKLFREAYYIGKKLNKNDAMVLNHLANIIFMNQVVKAKKQSSFQQVLTLANHAVNSSSVEAIQAESHFQLARAYHNNGEFDEAFKNYYQATKLSPSFTLAHYGLGQMYIGKGERQKASECFEKVWKEHPDNYETLKILGSLYGKSDNVRKREKAIGYLKQVSILKPKDFDNWIELAMLREPNDKQGAIDAYMEALKLFAKFGFQVPAEILNNLGSLYSQINNLTKSKEFYEKALAVITSESASAGANQDEDTVDYRNGIAVTLKYNLARLEEMNNHTKSFPRIGRVTEDVAGETEGEVLLMKGDVVDMNVLHEGRWDVALRAGPDGEGEFSQEGRAAKIKATVASDKVEEISPSAINIYQDLLLEHTNYTHCYLSIGSIEAAQGNLTKAQEQITLALSTDKKNPEVWTAWGNLYMNEKPPKPGKAQKMFETITADTKTKEDPYSVLALGNIWLAAANSAEPDKRKKYLDYARDNYKMILKKDKKNVFAANGIGCVLASQGRLVEAKDCFISAREAAPHVPEPWINLAHIYVEQKNFANAIKMYENCLKKFYANNDAQLLQYLARACYKSGKYGECLAALQKAVLLSPENMLYRYNMAVACLAYAENILRTPTSTLVNVQHAITHLRNARLWFQYLLSSKPRKVNLHVANEKKVRCNEYLTQAKNQVTRAEKKEEERERDRQANEQTRQMFAQERIDKKELEQKQQAALEQEKLDRVEKFQGFVQAGDLLTIEVKRKAVKQPRKKKEEQEELEMEEGGSPREKKKRPSKRKEKKEREPRKSKKRRKLAKKQDSDDSDSDDEQVARKREQPGKFKSQQFVEDSDNSDADLLGALNKKSGSEDSEEDGDFVPGKEKSDIDIDEKDDLSDGNNNNNNNNNRKNDKYKDNDNNSDSDNNNNDDNNNNNNNDDSDSDDNNNTTTNNDTNTSATKDNDSHVDNGNDDAPPLMMSLKLPTENEAQDDSLKVIASRTLSPRSRTNEREFGSCDVYNVNKPVERDAYHSPSLSTISTAFSA